MQKSFNDPREKNNEIPVPRSYNQLKGAIESTPEHIPHFPDAGIRIFLIPTGVPNEPDIIFFVNPEYIAQFKNSPLWCIDGTFNVVPFVEGLQQLITIMTMKDGQVNYIHLLEFIET